MDTDTDQEETTMLGFNVRMEDELIATYETQAARERRSRSGLMRFAIERGLIARGYLNDS